MQTTSAVDVSDRFVHGMARIAAFWGAPKAMGAAYAAVYLSPAPLTLDDLVQAVGVTKGALSTHMAQLERLGLVQRDSLPRDRKDYFTADTDFWGVVRKILRERQQREFDRALRTVDECLAMIDSAKRTAEDPNVLAFYRERIVAIQRFFHALDRIVGALLAVEDFREAALAKLLGRPRKHARDTRRTE